MNLNDLVILNFALASIALFYFKYISLEKHHREYSVHIISLFLSFRLRLDFSTDLRKPWFHIIALSPLIVHLLTAVTTTVTELWNYIASQVSHYTEKILIPSWIGYSQIKRADIRTVWQPYRTQYR